MKFLSIKNIFEFKDNHIDGVRNNLLKNSDQLQGLGLPDVCIVTKQQPTHLMKSSFETQSSFHFVQGLCPQSQADVFAYLQTIFQNQEKQEHQSLFSKIQSIQKLTYICYDIFSRTFIVCEIQVFPEGQHKSKSFGVQENQQYILPSRQHWQGVYISSILRAIDEEFKLASVGRFFNNINLKNNNKLSEVIQLLLELITTNISLFQDLDKISSIKDFPDIKDVLFYLCWPLEILVQYLEKSYQLSILIKELENIEDSVIFYLIKSILFYKLKNYEKSLSCLVQISSICPQLNLIKYIFGKVLIKLGRYKQAFLMLKDTLINSNENQTIWITLASIFRKKNNYQICLSLLNKAAGLSGNKARKSKWREIHIQNYRVLAQDNSINNLTDLDKVYAVINPIQVNKIESFSQLSNHPVLEQLLLRQRAFDKKDLKNWYLQAQKQIINQAQKIEKSTIDFISQNLLLENKQALSLFQKEIIRLSIQVGQKQLQKYLQLYFYSPPHSSYSFFDNKIDKYCFEIKLKNKKQNNLQKRQSINTSSITLGDIDSDEETEPEFLKQNLNKTYDFTNTYSQSNLQSPNSKQKKSNTKITQQLLQKQISKTYQVIQENAFESVESERDCVNQCKEFGIELLQKSKTMETLSEQSCRKELKVQISGLIDHLDQNTPQDKQNEIGDLMKRKKDTLNPILQEFVDKISLTQNILDDLFYNNNQKTKSFQSSLQQSFNCSEKQTPKPKIPQIFKSQLKESVKKKNYLSKKIDIKDIYNLYGLSFQDNDEKSTYFQFTKQESIFLYKCSKIAAKLKQFELAQKLLEKINTRVISVQISYSLLHIYKDDHPQLIQLIQKTMVDFIECGISKIESMPLWVEIHFIRLIKLKGSNYVLGLLSQIENQDVFKLMKKIVLQTENLL
ncbi:unnamed protein product [Paramecium pentaurelia]|uniref:Tetratricopeptide repeat protein n=1 Tax=Paramecium pentaurelia TaxID=43138 RepID=A0A8S1XPY7_9CILI|nr:unnamed protein product [Paramecium pentaurelia]